MSQRFYTFLVGESMISYHPDMCMLKYAYGGGFKTVDTNDPQRLAKGISKYVWSPSIFVNGERNEAAFNFADWLALDFDSPGMSLDQAINNFCDCIHIIGTTRNNMKDKGGLICERYRVVLKLSARITSLRDYKHTVAKAVERYPCDPAPKDGARYFWPCQEIVAIGTEGFTETVLTAPPVDTARQKARDNFDLVQYQRYKKLPHWVSTFLAKGQEVQAKGRNNSFYAVARCLARLDMPIEEASHVIWQAPFKKDGIDRKDFEATMRSAYKGAERDG